jgi:type I restriction enzyme S subunit
MECISDEYGEVIELRSKQSNDAKGYTKFMEGDLVWARITPCMQNGKSAIVKNLQNGLGCGSTEYHVIRNNSPEIDLEYIYHLLRLKPVLRKAMSHFTGSAGQQRVPKSFLEELIIPIPPFSIQKKISDNMNNMKSRKKQMKIDANLLKELANQEFEQEIFKPLD